MITVRFKIAAVVVGGGRVLLGDRLDLLFQFLVVFVGHGRLVSFLDGTGFQV